MHAPQLIATTPVTATRRGRGLSRMAALAAALVLLAAPEARAARFRVGPGRTFPSIEAAINGHTYGPGDTIAVDAGVYATSQMLRPLGSGAAGRPIVVRGAGIGRTTISGSNLSDSKALWDVEQSNRFWTFEDLTVSGMRGAQTNARGFFLVGCADVVVQRCEVTDCWNGFMSASGAQRVTVQFCDVHHNGGLQGPAHNFYMSGGSDFVIRHNWIHDSQYGTCYKDRTHNLQLLYNRIENATIEGYEISLAGDGSGDQGSTLLLGNVIVKNPGSAQQTHFVRFEDGRAGTLTLIHNTLIGQSRNVMVSSIASQTTLHNNIFVGSGTLFGGGPVTGSNNWIAAGTAVPPGLAASVRGGSPLFQNIASGDFHLGAGSACIDAANPNVTPRPTEQWRPLPGTESRSTIGRAPDIGAFEAVERSAVAPRSWGEVKMSYR